MAALGNKISLAAGQAVKLNSASVAGAGTLDFVVPPHTAGKDFSAIFQVVGTLTTLTASLQASLDGGTTFNDLVAAASFLTTAAPLKVVTPLVSGAIYRINITVSTGGQDFYVSIN